MGWVGKRTVKKDRNPGMSLIFSVKECDFSVIPDPGEERLLVSISALAVVHLKSSHNVKVSSFFFFF